MTLERHEQLNLIACDQSMAVGTGLKTIQLCPDGEVVSTKGTFFMDAESAELVREAFDESGGELVIDYEHASLGGEYSTPTGIAPAAGWIRGVFYEPSGRGLLAMVEWNERARDFIRANEYKFISPVCLIRKSDKKVVAIESAALTNKPAIRALERVAASRHDENIEEQKMADAPNESAVAGERLIGELRSVLVDLGLELDGDGRDTVLKSAIAKLREFAKDTGESKSTDSSEDAQVANAVKRKLNLSGDASSAEVLLALSLSGSDSASGLAAMKHSEADRLAKDRVDKYVAKNVINPNDKDQYAAAMSLSRENPDRFESLMQRSTPWMPSGETAPPAAGTVGRQRIIATARTEFNSDNMPGSLTSMENFVNDALREKSLPVLTNDEITTLV